MISSAAYFAFFGPLVGAIFSGIFGRYFQSHISYWVTSSFIAIGALSSLYLLSLAAGSGLHTVVEIMPWISVGKLESVWSVRIDTVSTLMLCIVNIISFVVHVYSASYMAHDAGRVRFISFLSVFTFFMLVLVAANDLLQLFVGWEGVGLASYLLIGFWYHKDTANAAAIKAFVVNRVGDFALILGIAGVFFLFDTVQYDALFSALDHGQGVLFHLWGYEFNAIEVVALLLFVGAMGKSAQFGLHTWLPDAMEGPTPVSALLHSATMVTAGVFLLIRLNPLFAMAPSVLMFVAIIGTITALFAGTVAITQNDIKRVVAYSTCSQLGFMFVAIGVGAYAAAFFHLATHAFFKSLLFLGSGSVIHAVSDEQDMQKMGGLWRRLPYTYGLMLVGTLSLIGVPYFSGAISKETILNAAWGGHTLVGDLAYYGCLAAVFLTALYSLRLIILTFHGKNRSEKSVWAKVHESSMKMLWPLFLLGFASIFLGLATASYFIGNNPEFWWHTVLLGPMNHALEVAHHVPLVHYAAVLLMLLGVGTAFGSFQWSDFANCLAKKCGSIYKFLYHKWYFDELYDAVFVNNVFRLGRVFWQQGDQKCIDGLGPNGVAKAVGVLGQNIRRLQTGLLYQYAFVMLLGLVLFLSWVLWTL